MKIFAVAMFVVVGLGAVVVSAAEKKSVSCYKGVNAFCEKADPSKKNDLDCRAVLPQFTHSSNNLMEFANRQLEVSYKYMLLAAQFNSYVKDRPGFQAKFKELSDRSWAAGQALIKYVTKKGGHFKFGRQNELVNGLAELNEFQAMATVLDTEKALFEKARLIHEGASHVKQTEKYDPEIAHYIEEEFLEDLADSIRKYSGFANDLKNLYAYSNDVNMDNYLFDQYLQKV